MAKLPDFIKVPADFGPEGTDVRLVGVSADLKRGRVGRSVDLSLWSYIRRSVAGLSYKQYEAFIDFVMEQQQVQRDSATRGWQYLYSGVGIVVTLGTIALIGAGIWTGFAIFVVPVYWAGGKLLSQFLMATVVEPALDRRYPLSRSRRDASSRSRRFTPGS